MRPAPHPWEPVVTTAMGNVLMGCPTGLCLINLPSNARASRMFTLMCLIFFCYGRISTNADLLPSTHHEAP